MTAPSTQKSTIVRARRALQRASLRALDVAAPGRAARSLRDLWFRVPPVEPAAALPTGGESFAVEVRGATVRGTVFTPRGADEGEADAPVVYLVHGWGGRGSQLSSFVEPLVATGHRVVLYDALSHGDSDPGQYGRRLTHGVEIGHALDAVFARFGPAEAVVAHSMGAIATYLALRFGWLGSGRLVLVAPMVETVPLLDMFQQAVGFGARTRRAFDREVERFVGVPLEEFDAVVQARHTDPLPTLVVADPGDRQAPYAAVERLAAALPDARLVTTEGLGHRRILRDPAVVAEVVGFVVGARDEAVA
ncbi:alpha/beta fold hydrolase [Nocardioides sp. GCM10027113]|uniref:alpha/beta fold hydrolase n=1 Tax=unclassified Nocardioides TaxID=2615069 RepID=UPI003621D69C